MALTSSGVRLADFGILFLPCTITSLIAWSVADFCQAASLRLADPFAIGLATPSAPWQVPHFFA